MATLRRIFRPRLGRTCILFTVMFFTVLYVMIRLTDIDANNISEERRRLFKNKIMKYKQLHFGSNKTVSETANDNDNVIKEGPNARSTKAIELQKPHIARQYTEEEIKAIFEKLVIEKDTRADAPGVKGTAVTVEVDGLSAEQATEYFSGWQHHGFNQYISDRISLQRDTPDVPDPECLDITFLDDLPTTSVIIIFYNEALSTLLRTVYSIINKTPAHLLREIILIDDFSDYGALGRPLELKLNQLEPDEVHDYDIGWKEHGFNLVVSDRISLQRPPPLVPDAECTEVEFLEYLPDTSVVIVFYNEALSTLLRTVYSVINTSPAHLLKEIILVDDSSELEHLKEPLDAYIAEHFTQVRLIRTQSRLGLIQARLQGILTASAATVTFLDAHCECLAGWLEPLLDQVARNRTTVAMPVIDQIHYETFEHKAFSGSVAAVGTFTWVLNFDWLYTTPEEYMRRGSPISPTRSATMAGGLFTIDREFFRRLGYYDPQLQLYGAENLELSFKIWMCGGQLVQLPCSHVGHVFRNRTPYAETEQSQTVIMRNRMRVAEVWMDEYKKLFYSYAQPKHTDFGDVSERLELRRNLQCHSFQWYVQNVAPERNLPLNYIAFGMIENAIREEHGLEVCIYANYHESRDNGLHVPLAITRCDQNNKYQVFMLEEDSRRLRIDLTCLAVIKYEQIAKSSLEFKRCALVADTWSYTQDGHVKHDQTGQCLEMDSDARALTLSQCDVSQQRQGWKWNRD